jgi:hypothetical protein
VAGRNLKVANHGVLHTIEEVLHTKLDKIMREILDGRRAYVMSRCYPHISLILRIDKILICSRLSKIQERFRHALLIQRGTEATRYKTALELLLAIRGEAEAHILEIQNAKAEQIRALGKLSGSGASKIDNHSNSDDDDDHKSDEDNDSDGEDEEPDHVDPAHRKGSSCAVRLREARVLLHKAHFLLGDVYHQLGNVPKEDESYSAAEAARQNILRHSERRALSAMRILGDRRGHEERLKEGFLIPEIKHDELVAYADEFGGEESDDQMDSLAYGSDTEEDFSAKGKGKPKNQSHSPVKFAVQAVRL